MLVFFGIGQIKLIYAQTDTSETSYHPYIINGWADGSILVVGGVANLLGIRNSQNKAELTLTDIQSLDPGSLTGIDKWALNQSTNNRTNYLNYSEDALVFSVLLPCCLLFDKKIEQDWFDVLILYAETMSISSNIYEWSFLGPTFQNKFRPIVYYTQLNYDQKNAGVNRNSFYSGHTAAAAAATFFIAKVYSDYNPELGDNKYFLYGAAAIPPLIVGYFRVRALQHFPSDVAVGLGVGALVGILVPEFHHIQNSKMSLGLYSTPEATGIAFTWHPNFLN
jgi:hypothetical protein